MRAPPKMSSRENSAAKTARAHTALSMAAESQQCGEATATRCVTYVLLSLQILGLSFLLFCFETSSSVSVDQASFELLILLPLPTKYRNYR